MRRCLHSKILGYCPIMQVYMEQITNEFLGIEINEIKILNGNQMLTKILLNFLI